MQFSKTSDEIDRESLDSPRQFFEKRFNAIVAVAKIKSDRKVMYGKKAK
jgi:hypothetical protein